MKDFFKKIFNPDVEELNYTQRYHEISTILKEIGSAMASSITDLEETLKLIANAMLSLLKAQNVVIILFDETKNQWIPHTVVGLELESFLKIFSKYGEALTSLFIVEHPVNLATVPDREKIPHEFLDLLSIENTLISPLKLDNITVGSIIASRKTPVHFQIHDEELMEMLSYYAAITIENAIIHKREKEKALKLQTLREIDRILNSSLNLQEVLDNMVKKAVELLSANTGAVLLINNEKQELEIMSSLGMSEKFMKETKLKIGEGITGWVAQTGLPLLVNDVTKDKRYFKAIATVRSELAVPLKLHNKLIGVVNVDSDKPNKFSKEDMELLADFAENAAIAIKNARLFKSHEIENG
ncbi:MAG: GAF domain-containing protein [bacterium]|nr:GAF domain-containing protein [bacterium]